jgi:hypothetical protein
MERGDHVPVVSGATPALPPRDGTMPVPANRFGVGQHR